MCEGKSYKYDTKHFSPELCSTISKYFLYNPRKASDYKTDIDASLPLYPQTHWSLWPLPIKAFAASDPVQNRAL